MLAVAIIKEAFFIIPRSRISKLLLCGMAISMAATVQSKSQVHAAESDEPITFSNASVHDPSIIQDQKSGMYYVFGSHIAAAKSPDLINWQNFTNGYTSTDNTIYGDLSGNLSESFAWAGEDDADSKGGYAVWAPDVIWNKQYRNADGSKGAYMLYYSVSSTYIRSAIGLAVSKNIEGPYTYVDTIIYSGFTEEETYDANSDVNKQWESTNIDELVEEGVLEEPNPEWFTENGVYNNAEYTNAIDANVLYDKQGKLWMTYGSWSGGTFILELDKKTGIPLYPGEDGVTKDGRMIDRYFGTKIAAGYGRSSEGTYAVYDKKAGYYYLYLTYGGLASDGGYQMRQFRSKSITGPYVDAAGSEAVYPETFDKGVGNFPGVNDHQAIGNKLIGNFLFTRELGEDGTGDGVGYLSAGHNSYYIDAKADKEFLVFHTRFPNKGETHEVRVHQTFKNSNDWPVPTPYRYAGETITEVTQEEVTGTYKFVNHGNQITGQLTESTLIQLQADGTVAGAQAGTWRLYDDYRVELKLADGTYDGVFINQWDPTTEAWVMTFSGMSESGQVIWGSQTSTTTDAQQMEKIKAELSASMPESVVKNIELPTTAAGGTTIQWTSSDPAVISETGVVTRPEADQPAAIVTLTALIQNELQSEQLSFEIQVEPKEAGKLSAYYSFDETYQNAAGDQTDAQVTGDRINNTGGAVPFVEGIKGQAASFDGKSGLSLGKGLITQNAYTVAFWINPAELNQFTTAFFGAATEQSWISLTPVGPANQTMLWSGQQWYDAPIGSTIPADTWSHVAFTVSDGKVAVYTNGEERFAGEAFPNIFEGSAASFGLAVNYWDQPFKGLIDELYIQDGIVLPADEIKALYDEGAAVNPDALVAETSVSQSTLLYGGLAIGVIAIANVSGIYFNKSGKKTEE